MTSNSYPRTAAPAGLTISIKDKVTIGLILFFTTVALTLELYWLIYHQEMEARTDLVARLLSIYWPADRTYRIPGYPIEKAFTLSLEGVARNAIGAVGWPINREQTGEQIGAGFHLLMVDQPVELERQRHGGEEQDQADCDLVLD